MEKWLTWDETKRQINLRKHGLDFADAGEVLHSRFRLDVYWQGIDNVQELLVLSISYALGFLALLSVVHTERKGFAPVISFHRASRIEREVYDAWLENECDDA